ncbi:hypothetical protein MASR2M44_09050 [Bacteroidota bacterium]
MTKFASVMALFPFSEEQIVARLQFENPWWSTGNLDAFYQAFNPRLHVMTPGGFIAFASE